MTNLIDWNNELSIGIKEIDAQHKTLVDLLNKMHEAIREKHASEVVLDILDELILYTQTHFATEEALMGILGYEQSEAHKHNHQKLVDQVLDFKNRVVNEHGSVNFTLMHFLKQWLIHHIMEDDKAFGEFCLDVTRRLPHRRQGRGRLRLFAGQSQAS